MISKFIICLFIIAMTSLPYALAYDKVVVLTTKSGELVIEFFPDDAPGTVDNFIKLVESGFYDRTIFHRVIKDFMIQGGDPLTKPGAYEHVTQWGTGNAGYTIPAEFNDIKHNRGIVSMARSADPDSASSQFFIVHKDSNFLDGQYTVFGRLVTEKSYETLDKIASLEIADRDVPFDWGEGEILKAEIKDHSEIPNILELREPERIIPPPERIVPLPETNGEKYNNSLLGFSFDSPLGWSIQEPEKTQPNSPDVVVLGPLTDGFYPAISFLVENAEGKTLAEHMEEKIETLQNIDLANQLEILSEETTIIGDNTAHVVNTVGQFLTNTGPLSIKYKEITIKTNDKFYTLTYANQEKNFESILPRFNSVLETFEVDSKPNGGGCLIATAAFGSELASQVQQLREIRDSMLLQTKSGSAFMTAFNQLYYSFSPTIADWERQNPIFKEAVKLAITPLITTLSILQYVDIDSEQEMLGYGIGVILLNVGMYFVAPAIIIIKIRSKVNF